MCLMGYVKMGNVQNTKYAAYYMPNRECENLRTFHIGNESNRECA